MIAAIFAIDDNGGMGFQGRLPWPHNKDDMRWFKRHTENEFVVMGRNTWESPDMPKPLPSRVNFVVTNRDIECDEVIVLNGDIIKNLQELQTARPDRNIYVIGGPSILHQVKPILQRVFVTRIPGEFQSDTNINFAEFIDGFSLVNTLHLESCKIDDYTVYRGVV